MNTISQTKSRSATAKLPTVMKALAKTRREKGIWMVEEPLPAFGPDDVLIRVERTAICGTDVHIYEWDDWAADTIPVPMIIGHEFGGHIAALGENVKNLNIGQRVSGEGHIVGNSSRNARAGRYHLDPDTKGLGVHRPGAFAEYCAIPAFNVVPLPDFLDMDMAAILDPLGNATHTALSFDVAGEDVLITGAGPIGIMAAAICRHIGARHIVLTDINEIRLNLARHIPGIRCVNVGQENLSDVMGELGMREGFDVGFEMSGVASAFDQMVDSMIMGGKIALMGIPPKPTTVDWRKVIFKALVMKGIYGREMYETWYKMLALLESGLDLSWLITHRFSVDDYAKAFELMASGNSGKVILKWT